MKAVVVTLDRLQAASLGCYGHLRIRTPQFDRLAARSVVFDQHFGENFDPAAAGHAWTTGCYQFPASPALRAGSVMPGELLRGNGTAVVLVAERGADPIFRQGGWGTVHEIDGATGFDADPDETPFARLIAQGIEHLHRLSEQPGDSWLLWLHGRGAAADTLPPRSLVEEYADVMTEDEVGLSPSPPGYAGGEGRGEGGRALPTSPEHFRNPVSEGNRVSAGVGEPPGPLTPGPSPPKRGRGESEQSNFATDDWQTARCLYAGAVGLIDWGLGRLLDALDAALGGEPYLLIVAAARGETLGERAVLREAAALATEVVQTPLFLQWTGDQHRDRRQELVQTVDLLPTLLDGFGLPAERFPCEGRSLLPLARGEVWDPRSSVCLGRGPQTGGVRTPDFYLTGPADALQSSDLSRLRLLAKPDDLWDVHNVVPQNPAAAERLAALWSEFATRAQWRAAGAEKFNHG